jgi:hypothetical protein
VLSRFWVFLMERVDMVWASLDRGAKIDARTTQSPGKSRGKPQYVGGWPGPPAGTHSNAYYVEEVQSVLRSEIRTHVLNRLAFPPALNSWS